VLGAARRDISGEMIAIGGEEGERWLGGGPQSIVGVGFCLKPLDPPCLSGRANHDCHWLEHLQHVAGAPVPECCRRCAIREIGTETLRTGASFYIMTSAKDILLDVFVPALEKGRFSSGLFVLCRYSVRPFAVGLMASGMRGWMFPFERGDCRDYRTWLMADRGVKLDRTSLNESNRKRLGDMLAAAIQKPGAAKKYKRQGNILRPE
jgi:hypothetical protein